MSECKLCYAIKTVDHTDSNAIKKAIELKEITNVDLAMVMTNNGFPLSEASVRRHILHKDNQ